MNNTNFNLSYFEELSKGNGVRYWFAHDLAKFLEYDEFDSFNKNVIKKARIASDQFGIDSDEEFSLYINNDGFKTYKLTRFACFLCCLVADIKKPKVALLKIALAQFVESLNSISVDRFDEREKLSHGEKHMTSIAIQNGLPKNKIALFKDSGYRGMYNKSLNELKKYRDFDLSVNINLYDFMGIEELAANTFRTTQTAAKIRTQNLKTEQSIIKAANQVGKEVRQMVLTNNGKNPEDLNIESDIKKIPSQIKQAKKKMIQYDQKKKKNS